MLSTQKAFSGLWYINEPFARQMKAMTLPRLMAGKDPIPEHFKLPADAKLYDEKEKPEHQCVVSDRYLF